MEKKLHLKDKLKNASSLPPVYITVLGGLGEVGKNMLAIEMGNEM
jgi:mRNA degradation ribonuclease J1/J2